MEKVHEYMIDNHKMSYEADNEITFNSVSLRLVNDYHIQKTVNDFGRKMLDKQQDYAELLIIEKLSILLKLEHNHTESFKIEEPSCDFINSREVINEYMDKLRIGGSNVNKLYKLVEAITELRSDNDKQSSPL